MWSRILSLSLRPITSSATTNREEPTTPVSCSQDQPLFQLRVPAQSCSGGSDDGPPALPPHRTEAVQDGGPSNTKAWSTRVKLRIGFWLDDSNPSPYFDWVLKSKTIQAADLLWQKGRDSAGNVACKTMLKPLRPHVDMTTVDRFSEVVDVRNEGTMAMDKLQRVWQLFKPSSRFEPVSRQVTRYFFHVYIRVRQVEDVPIKVPLDIRAKVDSAQLQACNLWRRAPSRIEETGSTSLLARYVRRHFDKLDDDSTKARKLCAFFEEGLSRGSLSSVYNSLIELLKSRHRSVQEVCRVAKDADVADLLSSYVEYLSRLKKLSPQSFQLQTDFCLLFGNLSEPRRVLTLFDKTLEKLQASCRPLCLLALSTFSLGRHPFSGHTKELTYSHLAVSLPLKFYNP